MSLKTCLISIAILFSIAAQAQDKIYKKDGGIIEAKVKTVSTSIIYTRFDNQGGPEYTILKKDVSKIVYQNGVVDVFGGDTKGEAKHHDKAGKMGTTPKKYGDNLLSITPGAYTVALDGSINDPGIGICYERLLDDKGHISFNLPVIISFSSNKDYNSTIFVYGGSYYPGSNNKYTSFNFMPGMKFYPARNNEKVRYAIGLSFFTMFGGEPYYVYDNNSNQTNPEAKFNYTMYGFMITNSVNISATKHVFFAIEANGGIPVSDNRRQGSTAADNLFLPWMQYLFKVGYRF